MLEIVPAPLATGLLIIQVVRGLGGEQMETPDLMETMKSFVKSATTLN